jgi:ribonuclease HI
VERELSGGERQTTNNRMEIMALLAGLRALCRPTQVSVHIDSRYVMDAFEKGWLARWQRTGWRTSAKEPVANRDLWEMLLAQYARHAVTFTWVQGHAGVVHNERVDRLAVAARDRAGELGQEPFDK